MLKELNFIPLYKQGSGRIGNVTSHKRIIACGVTEKDAIEMIKWFNSYRKG